MPPSAFARRPRRALACLALVLVGGSSLASCASSSGGRSPAYGGLHRLTPQARALRQAYPEPLDLPRELDRRVAPPYTVEPGDVLLVQPANLDSPVRLPGDQAVPPDGFIQLGRYGQLQVAGKTVPQIEADARTLVEAQTRDAGPITARVVTRVSKVYYVIGEVNAPGAFPLQGRETVLDGILAAGGLNERASRCTITLARPTHPDGCRVVLPVCWNDIVQVGDTSTNYQLAAGDRIYVPTRAGHEEHQQRKKPCAPCGRPQTPCPPPECHDPPHDLAPPATPGRAISPRPAERGDPVTTSCHP